MCFTGHTPGSYLLEVQPLKEADGRAIDGAARGCEAAALCFTGHTPGSYLLEVQPLNEADGRAIDGAACDYEAAALCCTGQPIATWYQLGQGRYFT